MCTITVIRAMEAGGDTIRIACNRDESRTRPAALPPQERTYGGRRALLPIDPVSDGTWIGVNDAGLAIMLLNAYGEGGSLQSAPREPVSRGTIIPRLMGCAHAADAVLACREFDFSRYAAFRLVMVDDGRVVHLRIKRGVPSFESLPLDEASFLFTSSGLGDGIVDGPRRALFETMFQGAGASAAVQDRFHRHSWPDRRHLSVCMSREDACTVSYTVVEVAPDRISLTYYGDAPDRAVTPITRSLARGSGRPRNSRDTGKSDPARR